MVTEDAPLDPRNVYAATKVHGEHLLRAWARETSGGAFALRFHNVYGPGMPRDTPYAGVASLFRSELAAGRAPRVFEDGAQRRDFVHVDDVARAVVAATTADAGPGLVVPLNVGSGTVTTVGGLAQALADALDGPAPVVTGEFRIGDVRHVTASSDRAAQVLGWSAQIGLARRSGDLLTSCRQSWSTAAVVSPGAGSRTSNRHPASVGSTSDPAAVRRDDGPDDGQPEPCRPGLPPRARRWAPPPWNPSSNTCARSSSGIPPHVSSTATRTWPSCR